MESVWQRIEQIFSTTVPLGSANPALSTVLVAIAILIVAWPLAAMIAKRIGSQVPDKAMAPYAVRVVRGTIRVVAFYVAVTAIGLELAAIFAIVAGMAVGMAFGISPLITNLLAGIQLRTRGLVSVGHVMSVGGTTGRIVKVELFRTIVTNADGTHAVPSSAILAATITTHSNDAATTAEELTVSVLPGSDIGTVRQIMEEAIYDASGPTTDVLTNVVELGTLWSVRASWSEPVTSNVDAIKTQALQAIAVALANSDRTWLVRGPLMPAGGAGLLE